MPQQSIFEKEYSKLNDKQKLAVDTIEGPVMVIAGPGSGKTKVLSLRIANILKITQIYPSNILCLTFTDNASVEMKNRINKLIGSSSYDLNIFTFHSFCSYILKTYPEYFGDISNFEIVSDVEKIKISIDILENSNYEQIKPFKNPYYYVKELIRKISELKKEGIDNDRYSKMVKAINTKWEKKVKEIDKNIKPTEIANEKKNIDKLNELSDFFFKYEKKLKEIKRMDFDDIINSVLKELEVNEEFASSLQEKYQYILVDEYQDTNSAQNKLIELLSKYWLDMGGQPNIFVVGDDDQSIYRFQGASLENILFFKQKFDKTKVIVLDKNYRSNQVVVDVARTFIDHNQFQLSDKDKTILKQYKSEQKEGDLLKSDSKISLYAFNEVKQENYFIALKVKELLEKGIKHEEIAVLFRDNKDVNGLVDSFKSLSIPYQLDAGDDILETELVIKIIKLLELVLDPYDDVKFFSVASYDFFNINQLDLYKLAYYSKVISKRDKENLKLFEIITTRNLFSETKIENPEKLTKFVNNIVKWGKESKNLKLSNFFAQILRESGILDYLLKDRGNGINIENLNAINTLFEEIKKFEIINPEYALSDFLSDISLLKSFDFTIKGKNQEYNEKDKVRLMTAHRSKGLEFGYVFITNLVDKKWSNKTERSLIKFPINFVKLTLNEESDLSFNLTKEEKLLEKQMRLEDERRLLYVALTRAKHEIFLSYSEIDNSNGSSKSLLPSMFLSEIEELITKIDSNKYINEIEKGLKTNVLKVSESVKSNISEEKFISKVLDNFKLNPTALNSYINCGYKFKLNNIFKLPKSKSQILGSVLHKSLELFFKKYMKTNELPSKEELIGLFEISAKDEYITKKDYEDILKRGKKILTTYYDHYSSLFVKPVFVEYSFGHKNVYFEDIPLSGKIDKMEVIKESTNQTEKTLIKIVDYKSGKPKSEKDIEGENKNSSLDYKRQLLFYKLLSEYDRNFDYEAIQAEFDFLEPDQSNKLRKYTFEYTSEDKKKEYEDFKQLVRDSWKSIKLLKFERTKEYRNCESCEYKDHCWPKGIPTNSEQ